MSGNSNSTPRQTSENTDAELIAPLTSALDVLEDSVVIFDDAWRYVFVNKTGWKVLDRSEEGVLGKNVWALMPHLRNTRFEMAAKAAMKKRTEIEIEEYYMHRNEYYRTKFYPAGSYLVMRITNITDLVLAQEMNNQLMGDLQEAMEVYWSKENQSWREKRNMPPRE